MSSREDSAKTAKQMKNATAVADFVIRLHENYEQMQKLYIQLLNDSTGHNKQLVSEIIDLMGSIQYQDMMRQCIERVELANNDLRELQCKQ